MAEVLIIDDQEHYTRLCKRAIPEHLFHGPSRCWRDTLRFLQRHQERLDMVLLDMHFDRPVADLLGVGREPSPQELESARRSQGLHILARLRERAPNLPVILMTSRDDLRLEQAADRFHAEEYTYFLDDEYLDAHSLRTLIEQTLTAAKGSDRDGPVFWGRGKAMRHIRRQLKILARGRLPIILGGPTGTGKSLLARHIIHPSSERAGRFVMVDLSTIPRDLMAPQLFGSMKGSYTGAVSDRRGSFEEADGGTLFLDEIGNLSPEAQKMLLSVLQDGMVTRIGDTQERHVDVKLIAATHEDLGEMVRRGDFRADLYMRLNPACTIRLPSLLERRDDLELFLEFCVEAALQGPYLRELLRDYRSRNKLHGEAIRVVRSGPVPPPSPDTIQFYFSQRSLQMMEEYPWPGNLREYAMTVENALTFCLAELAEVGGGERPDVIQVRPRLIHDLLLNPVVAEESTLADDSIPITIEAQAELKQVSSQVERQYFKALYLKHKGDFSSMAEVLLGDPQAARKVQLRFNQLGLKVRSLKSELGL